MNASTPEQRTPDQRTPEPCIRRAYEIGGGALVIRQGDAGAELCLKLDRIGKEYIHHYLFILSPAPEGEPELLYVDPEDELLDCFATLELDLGPATSGRPAPGQAFENDKGCFIMALDDPKTQKMFGFADPASGRVCIRQDRKVKAVHADWSARARVGDELLELVELLERHASR